MSNRTHQCKRGPTHFNNWRSSGLFNVMHSNLNYYKTKQKMLKFNITTTITVLDLTSRLFILVEWRINAEFSVLYSNESLQTGINNNGIPLSLSLHLHRLLLMFLPSIPFFSSLQPLPVFFSLETLEPWKKKEKITFGPFSRALGQWPGIPWHCASRPLTSGFFLSYTLV